MIIITVMLLWEACSYLGNLGLPRISYSYWPDIAIPEYLEPGCFVQKPGVPVHNGWKVSGVFSDSPHECSRYVPHHQFLKVLIVPSAHECD